MLRVIGCKLKKSGCYLSDLSVRIDQYGDITRFIAFSDQFDYFAAYFRRTSLISDKRRAIFIHKNIFYSAGFIAVSRFLLYFCVCIGNTLGNSV